MVNQHTGLPAWTAPVPSAGRHQCLHLPWQRPVVLLLCWELLGWDRPRLQRARQPIAAAAERAGSWYCSTSALTHRQQLTPRACDMCSITVLQAHAYETSSRACEHKQLTRPGAAAHSILPFMLSFMHSPPWTWPGPAAGLHPRPCPCLPHQPLLLRVGPPHHRLQQYPQREGHHPPQLRQPGGHAPPPETPAGNRNSSG